MSDEMRPPVFVGTPDDWWEQAEKITEAEARNRALGNWYITRIRTAGDTKPGYRLSTPSKPYNTDQLKKDLEKGYGGIDIRVRRLITSSEPPQRWMTSNMVIADTEVGGIKQRLPWVRKNSGRWHSLFDGRITINDHTMMELNPAPARIVEEE